MIKNVFQSKGRAVRAAARQGSPALWPGAGSWWQARSVPATSMWSCLWGSSFPGHLGGGGGVVLGQSFRCWEAGHLQLLLQREWKRFRQRMVKEFNLAALNHPQEQAAFPSPSEGGGMTGFLISEPRVRERSHPPELSCLRCFPCRVQLPLGGRWSCSNLFKPPAFLTCATSLACPLCSGFRASSGT